MTTVPSYLSVRGQARRETRAARPRQIVLWSALLFCLSGALVGLIACGGGSASSNVAQSGGGGGGGTGGGGTPSGTIPATYFSILVNHVTDTAPWTKMVAPFGAFRFWDTGTKWGELQPIQSDPPNFQHLDAWMADLQANGVTHAMFSLSGTARWASQDPNNQIADCAYADDNPPENYGYCAPPVDLNSDGTGPDQYWRNWVAAISQRLQTDGVTYGVTIDGYDPWNEFTGELGNTAPGNQVAWEGTNQQLVRMVQDARCIIKGNLGGSQTTEASGGQTCAQVLQSVNLSAAVDPSALFLSPSTPVAETSRFQTAWDAYMSTPGAADAADGYSLHLYAQTKLPIEENLLQKLLIFESDQYIVAGVQAGKPIWATEGSWNGNSELPDADDQAAYVARDYLLFFSDANIERFYWYDLDEVCEPQGCNPDGSGNGVGTLLIPPGYSTCTNPNGCVLSGGTAYGQVYNWMTGATQTAACNPVQTGSTVWTCGFTRQSPSGYQAQAIWDISQTCSPTCTTTSYDLGSSNPYVQYRDLTGNVTPISNNQVSVGEKPVLLENMSQ